MTEDDFDNLIFSFIKIGLVLCALFMGILAVLLFSLAITLSL